jgi:uncharacterized protein YegL
VFIPEELSQKDYPNSCKFYDPIIAIIKDGIPDDRKQYFFFNNKDRIAEYKKYNFLEQLSDKWFNQDVAKANFKYDVVNEMEEQ